MSDEDLILVRRFRASLDDPPPGALTRTRPVAQAAAAPAPRRLRRLAVVPLAAGAMVAATLVAVAWTLPRGGPAPTAPPASATPPAPPSPTPAPPSAAQVIEELARRAERRPDAPRPRPEQRILVQQTQYDSVGAFVQERWLDPEGGILLRVRTFEAGGFVDEATETDRARWIAMSRTEMARIGPGLRYPTWMALSTQTTDPAALQTELTGGRPTDSGMLVRLLADVFPAVDMLAPARLEAALLRMLASRADITATQAQGPDGRQVWAIGAASAESFGSVYELLVDPDTGRVTGHREPGNTYLWDTSLR